MAIRSGSHADYARLSRRELAAIDVIPSAWYADYPSPSSFFDTFLSCRSATAGGFWCDPGLDRLVRRAHALEATDLARADVVWARADRRGRQRGLGAARQPARAGLRLRAPARLPQRPPAGLPRSPGLARHA